MSIKEGTLLMVSWASHIAPERESMSRRRERRELKSREERKGKGKREVNG